MANNEQVEDVEVTEKVAQQNENVNKEESCETSVSNIHNTGDNKEENNQNDDSSIKEENDLTNETINIDIPLNNDDSKEKNCLQLPVHESNKLDVLPNSVVRNNFNNEKKDENNFVPSEEEEIAHPVGEGRKNSKCTEHKRVGWMRHYVALFALVGIVLANMNRQAFNQALVKMTKQGDREVTGSTTATSVLEEDNFDTTTTTTTVITSDTFAWDSEQIAKLQSAFSYGYIPFMIFSARISELYGAKWVIFLSGFGSALCCLLSPFLADTNYYLLMGSRVVMGLCQTGVSPALYALLVRWLPPEESSVYLPMMKVGATLGFTFGSVIAGFFTWRHTFYIVAVIGFLWSIIWPITVESDPDQSKFISNNEFNYIRQEIGKLNKNRKQSVASSRKKSAPWIQIFTHPVVLAFMITKLTVKMSTDAQTQQFAMYLKAVFNMDDKMNGMLNGINYAIQALLTGLIAWSAQEFVVRKKFGFNKTGVRKLYQGICNFGMGVAFISITFNMSSITLVCCSYLLLSIASMFGAGGEAVLPVDLTTDYAATIMSIANFTANLSGIILPEIVARILKDERTDPDRWNLIWLIIGTLMCTGGLIFTLFVRAEILNFENSFLIDFINYIRGTKTKAKKDSGDRKDDIELKTNSINNTVMIQMSDLQSIQETSD